jgi:hypothetical protein
VVRFTGRFLTRPVKSRGVAVMKTRRSARMASESRMVANSRWRSTPAASAIASTATELGPGGVDCRGHRLPKVRQAFCLCRTVDLAGGFGALAISLRLPGGWRLQASV